MNLDAEKVNLRDADERGRRSPYFVQSTEYRVRCIKTNVFVCRRFCVSAVKLVRLTGRYFPRSITSVFGSAVIFNVGTVTCPVASAVAVPVFVPLAAP
jgi:hypothetical protein